MIMSAMYQPRVSQAVKEGCFVLGCVIRLTVLSNAKKNWCFVSAKHCAKPDQVRGTKQL